MNPISNQILSLSSEAALILEKNRIAFANTAALELLGRDCVGKTASSLFGPELGEVQAGSFVADVPIQGRHFLVRFSRLDDSQVLFLCPADTHPVQLNDALLFCANSTLNNISISTDKGRVLAEALGNTDMVTNFATLTRSCFSLTRLMTNATIVRGLAEGSLTVEYRLTDLSLLLRNLMESIALLCPNWHFHLDLGQEISAPVDYQLICQLLFNLVSNCILHAEGGSRVTVSLDDNRDWVFLSVRNDGKGIDPEELYGVFDRYRHAFSPLSVSRGAGMGLTVARGAAQMHGGALMMESRPDRGTCVRVSLSKKAGINSRLRTPQEDYSGKMRSILEGLAECLPPECFTGEYTD